VDSRRLLGPNRYGPDEGALVEVRLDGVTATQADALLGAWQRQAQLLLQALGWSSTPMVGSSRATVDATARAGGAAVHELAVMAPGPIDRLLALTEVLEMAWVLAEREAAAEESTITPALLVPLQQAAEREAAPHFRGVHAEAVARRCLTTFDDASLSIGAGRRAIVWARDDVPAPESIDWSTVGNVPTALITGSNGKTTVTRWLARLLREAGHTVGMSSTDGVFVDDGLVDAGDYSGPLGARMVLRDPRVTAAALETARGGILRRGLAVHHADAACVTNLSMDHFGEHGIDSLVHLAVAKLAVAHAVTWGGTLVLSADDRTLRALPPTLLPSAPTRLCWTTLDGNDAFVTAHARSGGDCAVLLDDVLLLHTGRRWHELEEVQAIPATLGGAARHNIANALSAAALAAALGAPIEAIQRGLRSFGAAPDDCAGRLVRLDVGGATIIVDYAHNPAAVEALIASTHQLPAARRAIAIGTGGNREDAAIEAMARSVVGTVTFDRIVVKDLPRYRRGRAEGEMPAIMAAELSRAGVEAARVRVALDDRAAVTDLLSWMRQGDLVLLTVHSERVAIMAWLEELRGRGWTAGEPLPPLPSSS
jgi:UDP-N-acetylmuramyl tripeptide synthase